MLKTTRPRLPVADAKTILRDSYGIVADLDELPSERDQNFLVTSPGDKLVLKVANASEPREVLELQNDALAHVARKEPTLPIPRLKPTRSGTYIAEVSGGLRCRLLTYLQGKTLADTRPHPRRLLRSLGRVMARLDVALQDFAHPARDRHLYWNSKHAATTIRDGIDLIDDSRRREWVAQILGEFEQIVAPHWEELPAGVIHNDGNDHNVLVHHGGVSGILDFGDLVSSAIVCEVANTAVYCMLGKSEPLAAAADVIAGYHEVRPLSELELRLAFPLMRTRLAMSVAICARQARDEPDKDYLRVSEASAWELIERLASESAQLAHYRFRQACGLEPHPRGRVVRAWLADQKSRVLPFELDAGSVHVLDLSVGSTELGGLDVLDDVERFSAHVFGKVRASGAIVGVGRYDEARPIYTSAAFQPAEGRGGAPRTVHLGVDLFVEAGTSIRAPLSGMVHSFHNNDAPLDYGPTIILEHTTDDGDRLWTLYGHLALSSLQGLHVGKRVERGDVIATVGHYPVNGNWPPHLHFQIILDVLGYEGDFPGVAASSERDLWIGLCPDPSTLVGLPSSAAAPRPAGARLREQRHARLSGTLSLTYDEPLHIVRGYRSFLYDADGRPYLDMVNNVCHVGHCHPDVVRAASEQVAVLNTNTRYLHENIVGYAERLTAKLPRELEVCFFVNSGSEANDLALRLARTHTGRKGTLVLDGAYHGNLTSLIEVSPYKFDGRGGSGPPPHVEKLAMPDGFRGKYRAYDPGYGSKYVADARETIERLAAEGRPIGSFIAESILSCGGQIVLPPHYLRDLYRIVRDAGGVCIADEVQVGFGRVGSHFWGFQTQDAVPDIVTLGKPIGNGHPLGAVVTTRAVAESFETGMEYFNTFGGNPVSCTVGLAVLDAIENEGLQENAAAMGSVLMEGLRELQSRHPIIGDVRGRGLFLGFELVRDRDALTPAAEEASYLVNRMKELGVLTSTDGPLENVIKLKPPLVLSQSNAELFLDRLGSVLTEDRLQP